MTSDDQLLRRYAQNRDETAFAELVGRYVDMVYSIALRLTYDDTHLAQEVSQSVFTDLARKAAPLSSRATLSGWLHTSVRYAAHKALRGERRRRRHEQEAFTMQDHPTMPEAPWEQLQPLLDEAVGALREQDRDIVALRFFQNKSHREVGDALGLGEEAARKRVDRALEKLRAHFARRGVIVSAGVLAATIGANSVQAAPMGLALTLSNAAVTSATGGGATGTLLHTLYMTTKTKIAIVTAAVVAGIAALPLQIQHSANARLQNELSATQQKQAVSQAWQHKAEAQLASQAQELKDYHQVTMTAAAADPSGLRPTGPAPLDVDPVAALPSNLDAAFKKDPASTLSVVAAFYAKTAAVNNLPQTIVPQTVDPAILKDPAAAATAAMNMPTGQERNRAIVAAAQAWVQQDPAAAAEWMNSAINSIPQDNKTQEHVIEALLPAAINENPQVAFAWASTIADDQVRSNRIMDVVNVWAKTDPAGAIQAVQSANLPDQFKSQLTQALNNMQNPAPTP